MSKLNIISEQEKKKILDLHNVVRESLLSKSNKKHLNEQVLTGKDLLVSIKDNCKIGKGGVIKQPPGKPAILYKKADYDSSVGNFKTGDELFIHDDMTFSVRKAEDGEYVTEPNGDISRIAFQCQAARQPKSATTPEKPKQFSSVQAEIDSLKDKGWRTKEELRKEGKDVSNLSRDYNVKKVGDVVLYLLIGARTGEFANREKESQAASFVQWMNDNDFVVDPTVAERMGLFPIPVEWTGYPGKDFSPGTQVYVNRQQQQEMARKNVLRQQQKARNLDRGQCKELIDTFYDEFIEYQNTPENQIPNRGIIQRDKIMVQSCVNRFYQRWGIGAGKVDDKIDVLTGNSSSKNAGRNSIFRLQAVTKRI